jgi:hypothetical protein
MDRLDRVTKEAANSQLVASWMKIHQVIAQSSATHARSLTDGWLA